MNWSATVKIKHLLTKQEDYESVQASMNQVADVIEKEPAFIGFRFHLPKFRSIPQEYSLLIANQLMSDLYDYADGARIWIE